MILVTAANALNLSLEHNNYDGEYSVYDFLVYPEKLYFTVVLVRVWGIDYPSLFNHAPLLYQSTLEVKQIERKFILLCSISRAGSLQLSLLDSSARRLVLVISRNFLPCFEHPVARSLV